MSSWRTWARGCSARYAASPCCLLFQALLSCSKLPKCESAALAHPGVTVLDSTKWPGSKLQGDAEHVLWLCAGLGLAEGGMAGLHGPGLCRHLQALIQGCSCQDKRPSAQQRACCKWGPWKQVAQALGLVSSYIPSSAACTCRKHPFSHAVTPVQQMRSNDHKYCMWEHVACQHTCSYMLK